MCFVTVGLRGLKQLLVHSDLLSSLQDLVHSTTSDRRLALLMVGGVKLRKLILYELPYTDYDRIGEIIIVSLSLAKSPNFKIWNFGPNPTNNINFLQGCIL